ncbi:hypothetical protein [Microbacterium sp. P01]|uniref:hypothetical protein n=1 Tax=unclassified Microbacterium TaxID=2609290 RepID=UPI00366AC999
MATTRATLVLIIAGVLALAGCTAAPDASPTRSPSAGVSATATRVPTSAAPQAGASASPEAGATTAPQPAPEPGSPEEAASACAPIQAAVEPYIGGLTLREGSGAVESGQSCGWQTGGETDAAAPRAVEVIVSSDTSEQLSPDDLASAGLDEVPDAAIEAAGGTAYTTEVPEGEASVIITIVSMPDRQISITGGNWDGYPVLDGPAAVAVAKTLLGI